MTVSITHPASLALLGVKPGSGPTLRTPDSIATALCWMGQTSAAAHVRGEFQFAGWVQITPEPTPGYYYLSGAV